jgi:hypothetical protein
MGFGFICYYWLFYVWLVGGYWGKKSWIITLSPIPDFIASSPSHDTFFCSFP